MDTKNHIYSGLIQPQCTIDGEELELEPSLKVRNHSPDGFSWGYGGSGPSQLALAIMLIELGGDEERALELYRDFKNEVIAKFHVASSWRLSSLDVHTWLKEKEHEEKLRQPAKPYVQGEITAQNCYNRGLELNELALKDKKLQAVDMGHLRSNMHMMRGHEFVAWFNMRYGGIPNPKE